MSSSWLLAGAFWGASRSSTRAAMARGAQVGGTAEGDSLDLRDPSSSSPLAASNTVTGSRLASSGCRKLPTWKEATLELCMLQG